MEWDNDPAVDVRYYGIGNDGGYQPQQRRAAGIVESRLRERRLQIRPAM